MSLSRKQCRAQGTAAAREADAYAGLSARGSRNGAHLPSELREVCLMSLQNLVGSAPVPFPACPASMMRCSVWDRKILSARWEGQEKLPLVEEVGKRKRG